LNIKKIMATLGLAGMTLVPVVASAANNTVVVNPGNTHGWVFLNDVTEGPGNGKFVTGPKTPPLGSGSVELSVDAAGRQIIKSNDFAGTRLADINKLSYATYAHGTGTVFGPSLQFDVDYDLTTTDTAYQGRLVYEPYVNGTPVPETWQTWDTLAGKWWASKTTSAGSNGACPQSAPCTKAELLAAFPNMGISNTGGLLAKVGGQNTAFTGNVDAIKVGVGNNVTTYNFEAVPSKAIDCKKDGYKAFTDPPFASQKECVKYVNKHNKDKNHNHATVTNNNQQTATSGNANSNNNTTGGNATSGNASNSNTTTNSLNFYPNITNE
jgi:hypothetical protein